MKSLQRIMNEHERLDIYMRLGQFFVTKYIEKPWPELYHERDDEKAKEEIRRWLEDHQYIDTKPQSVLASASTQNE